MKIKKLYNVIAPFILFFLLNGCAVNVAYNKFLEKPGWGCKPWYTRIYSETCWPDTNSIPDVVELPYFLEYSYTNMINQVFKSGVLYTNWASSVLKVPAWVVRDKRIKRDAYIYRQNIEDGFLQICDSRSFLVVGIYFKDKNNLQENASNSLSNIFGKYFAINIPANWHKDLSKNKDYNIYEGRISYDSNESIYRGIIDSKLSYNLLYFLGDNYAIFEFQKYHVPGCLTGTRPLFQPAGKKPGKLERAYEYINSLKQPCTSDIPAIVETLVSLPELNPLKQKGMYSIEYKLLSRTKYSGLDTLIMAMDTIDPASNSVEIIRETLKARPKEHDLRSHGYVIEEKAIDKLKKINTDSARALLEYISVTSTKSYIRGNATEIILKSMPEEKLHDYCYNELKKLAKDPDSYPEKVKYFIIGLGVNPEEKDLKVIKNVQQRTKNKDIIKACANYLEKAKAGFDQLR